MIPILGFAPDADQTTPGILSNCNNLIPYSYGMEGAPTGEVPLASGEDALTGIPALEDPCAGAAVMNLLDDTRRTIAGTADALYELSGIEWVDKSSAPYTGGEDARWSFAQFGNTILASNLSDAMQRSVSSEFADIAGAPKAKIIFSVGVFVMALHVDDGTLKQDGWHCCAAFDDTDWTESTVTQSASARLVSTPGGITAGGAMGEYAIAYKKKSIYLGQYVGAPSVWDWTPLQGGEAGCVGQEAWCEIGGAHFVVGVDNFYIVTPSGVTPLGDGVIKEWFVQNSSPVYLYRTKCLFDRSKNRVYVFYPSSSSESCDQALVYHIQAKKWGKVTISVQAVLNYISQGYVIDGLGSLASTWEGLPDIPYDSPFWSDGATSISIFTDANELQNLTGSSSSSSLTTGDVGDDDQLSLLRQIRLRYALAPTSATVQTYSRMNSGIPGTSGPSGTMNDGKFDVLKSSRWHYARVTFSGDVQITGMKADYVPDGMF